MSSLKLEIQSLKSRVCNQGSEVRGQWAEISEICTSSSAFIIKRESQWAAVSLGRLEPDLKALVEKVFGSTQTSPIRNLLWLCQSKSVRPNSLFFYPTQSFVTFKTADQ